MITPTAFLLSGVSAYACLSHIQVGIWKPDDRKHILFAAMCLCSAIVAPFHALSLTSTSIPEFAFNSHWSYSVNFVFTICMLWFVAAYTGKRPIWLLAGFSAIFALMMAASIPRPYGLQFNSITSLRVMELPWGETFIIPEGEVSTLFKIGVVFYLTALGYMLYAMQSLVRRSPTRNNIGMMIALSLFAASYVEAILVRTGILNCLPLGLFGGLGLVIVMSMVLNQEHSEERKAAAQAIEREHTRLATILETASDGIYIIDRNGLLIDANDAFLDLVGFDRDAIGKRRISEWNAQFDNTALRTLIQDMLDRNDQSVFETRIRRQNGTLLDVETSTRAIELDGGRYLCCASRDITERKSRQLELERCVLARTEELATARAEAECANAVKTRFMANISHEMRTPLNCILGLADIGRRKVGKESDDVVRGYFDKVLDSGNRLNRLTESLLNLAFDAWKERSGVAENDLHMVSPEALIIQAISLMTKTAASRQQKIVLERASVIPSVQGDEARLRQVLEYLLGNALRYSPEHATVTIRVREKPSSRAGASNTVLIQIIDEGCGVPEKEMDAIFEPFYESSRTATGAGGTGLGLALCKSIVQRHKGRITVSNRPEGGAIFEVTLPVMHALGIE